MNRRPVSTAPISLSLRKLRYFVAVAEELHFGRAAGRLHIAQPALSQQIRLLETELDTPLFERTTRRVSLTAAGTVLLDQARRLLVAADGVERAARELRDGERGILRLGFVDSTAYEMVPRFLRRFRELRPNIDFELHSMSSDEQYVALRDGTIDLGISRTAGAAGDLDRWLLGSEPFVLAVGSTHPFADRQSVELRELGSESFIGFDKEVSPTLHAEMRLLLAAAGVRLELAMQATEYTTILGLVAAGVGISMVPSSVRTFRPPGLRFIDIADEDARVDLVLLSRPAAPLATVQAAIKVLTELTVPELDLET